MRILHRTRFFLVSLLLGFLPLNGQAAEVITVAADKWCPYNCDPEDARPGIIIELLKEAFESKGIEVKYVIMPWSRAIEEARQGKLNGIVAASHSDAPDFVFPTTEQGWMRNVFYVRDDNPWIYEGSQSLSEVILGVAADYTYGDTIDRYIKDHTHNPQRVQVIGGEDVLDNNIKKLLAKRIDVLLEDEAVMIDYLRHQSQQPDIKPAGYLPPSSQSQLFVAFTPINPESTRYANMLAQETNLMRADGRLKAILARYGVKDWKQTKPR